MYLEVKGTYRTQEINTHLKGKIKSLTCQQLAMCIVYKYNPILDGSSKIEVIVTSTIPESSFALLLKAV